MTNEPGAGFPSTLGQYTIGRRLGAGGMGTVFEAVDRRADVRVAVKLLHPHLAADTSYRERFEREAHVAALLRSPYTVHVLDYGFDQGYYYIVMQFVDGHSVADELRTGPIDPARALHIATDTARALEEAEARNVVHRDIKPENVLLGNDGSVKVADFGIARQTYSAGITVTGGFVGTSAFAAPEQADGQVDTRTDIYAVGGTLFTMLTGHQPFSGSPLDLLRQHRDSPPPIGELAHLPPMVGQVVAKCLEKRREQRYQHPSELVGALERAMRDVESGAPAPMAATMVVPPDRLSGGGAQPSPSIGASGPRGTVVTGGGTGSGAGALRMELKPQTASIGSRVGAVVYTLLVESHLQQPTDVALRFDDPSGSLGVDMPKAVTVPPMGSSVVAVRMRPRKRRWLGPRVQRTFQVTADGSSGGVPPVSATGQIDDLPFGPIVLGSGTLGILAVAAVAGLGVARLFGGSDDPGTSPTRETEVETRTPAPTRTKAASTTVSPSRTTIWGGVDNSPVPTSTASAPTATATATATATRPTSPATATTTLPAPTATRPAPTATPQPTAIQPPTLAANTGTWTITLDVTRNDCPFGQFEGGQVQEAYEFYEAIPGNDYMEPGELIEVYQSRTGAYLGDFTFSYPVWTISYSIVSTDGSPGTAWLMNTFTALDRTVSYLEERYFTATGQCEIVYE